VYLLTSKLFVERHLIERVDRLVRVTDKECVDAVFGQVLHGVQPVCQVIGHVLDEDHVTVCNKPVTLSHTHTVGRG
jgi:hypothetical protein